MRTPLLVLALLLATTLAGCTSDEPKTAEWEEKTSEPSVVDPVQTTQTNQTEAPSNTTAPANTPPVASLIATETNGTAPLNVSFALDGSDADGDNLTWSFDDGNGNSTTGDTLPASVNATYMAGNWTATLTVNDGTNQTVQTLLITVGAGAEVPAAVTYPDRIVWSGLTFNPMLGCLVLGLEAYFYFDVALSGVWKFHAESSTGVSDLITEWWAGDSGAGDLGPDGIIPEGADNVAVCPSTPVVPDEFTLTLYHPDDSL